MLTLAYALFKRQSLLQCNYDPGQLQHACRQDTNLSCANFHFLLEFVITIHQYYRCYKVDVSRVRYKLNDKTGHISNYQYMAV